MKTFSPVKVEGKVGSLTLHQQAVVFKSKALQMETSYPWTSIKKHMIKSVGEEKHMLKILLLDESSVVMHVRTRERLEEIKAEIANVRKRTSLNGTSPGQVAADASTTAPQNEPASSAQERGSTPTKKSFEQQHPLQPTIQKNKSKPLYPPPQLASRPDFETPEIRQLQQFAPTSTSLKTPPQDKKREQTNAKAVKSIPGAHRVSHSAMNQDQTSNHSKGPTAGSSSTLILDSEGEASDEFSSAIPTSRERQQQGTSPPNRARRNLADTNNLPVNSARRTQSMGHGHSVPATSRLRASTGRLMSDYSAPSNNGRRTSRSPNRGRAKRVTSVGDSPPRLGRHSSSAMERAKGPMQRQRSSPTRTRRGVRTVSSGSAMKDQSDRSSGQSSSIRRNASCTNFDDDSMENDDSDFMNSVLQERQDAVLHPTARRTQSVAVAPSSTARLNRAETAPVPQSAKPQPQRDGAQRSTSRQPSSSSSSTTTPSRARNNGSNEAGVTTTTESTVAPQQEGMTLTEVLASSETFAFVNQPDPIPFQADPFYSGIPGAVCVGGDSAGADDEAIEDSVHEGDSQAVGRPLSEVERTETGDVLIEAHLVEERSVDSSVHNDNNAVDVEASLMFNDVVEASPMKEPKEIGCRDVWKSRKVLQCIIPVLLLFLLVAVIASVILAVTLPSDGDTNQNNKTDGQDPVVQDTPPPTTFVPTSTTPVPASAPTMPVEVEPFLVNAYDGKLPEYTLVALEDRQSPQSRAQQYLASNRRIESTSASGIRKEFGLASFFYATNGDTSWTNNDFWLKRTVNPCNWYQAATPCPGGKGAIGTLSLPSNNLEGTVPPELFYSMSSLREVDLSDNAAITGPLPSDIGALTILEYLNISQSSISGAIPTETGMLTKLRSLDLSSTLLTGTLPTELGLLTSLTLLSVGNNGGLIGRIPRQLENLQNLLYVDLSSTGLSGPQNPFCNMLQQGLQLKYDNSGIAACPG
ncbi:Leucine Rich Repeat [Seminavis robusta]|uniref:Leucine Rich Repeat n=1 Tax=Seminavis robusta TaxID=568900 RepID=A0A9N8HQP3_9STRA|nr:Leucine Rich Repeat [Seminavis robusta]|eukprot:Sro1217_g253270.1 Leucine Rich Repeat (977) ;mRNA; r:24212-27142